MRLGDLDVLRAEIEKMALWLVKIQVLQMIDNTPTVETVSTSAYKQVAWERDLAIHQLSQYGIELGQAKDEDLVRVVRCKDCKCWVQTLCRSGIDWLPKDANDFCSYGEPKEV